MMTTGLRETVLKLDEAVQAFIFYRTRFDIPVWLQTLHIKLAR